jgi:hypothetical protein
VGQELAPGTASEASGDGAEAPAVQGDDEDPLSRDPRSLGQGERRVLEELERRDEEDEIDCASAKRERMGIREENREARQPLPQGSEHSR